MSALAVTGALVVTGAVVLAVIRSPGSGASKYSVTTTLKVGTKPVGVAVDPETHRVYVTNSGDGTVSVIDGSKNNNMVIATAKVGTNPAGVAVDPKTHRVYVTNSGDGTVSVIDGSKNNNTVIATAETGAHPSGLAPNLGTGFADIPVGHVSWVAADLGTDSVYVTNFADGTISKIDQNNKVIGTPLPVGNHPIALAADGSKKKLYVAGIAISGDNKTDGTVSVINGLTDEVTNNVTVGMFPLNVAVNPVIQTIYVSKSDGWVSVIDGKTNTVTTTVRVGTTPVGVAVDEETRTVYVTNSGDGTVSVIDGQTNKVIETVNVGQEPGFLAVDRLSHTVYVPNSHDNNVSVIRPRQ